MWLFAQLIAVLLPFERLPQLGSSSIRLSSIVLAISLVPIPFVANRHRYFQHFTLVDRLITVFYVLFVISATLSADRHRSLYLAALLGLLLWGYFFFRWASSDPLRRHRLCKIIETTGVLVGIFGLYQFFADSAGLPSWATGLLPRYHYTVLSFPRIQSVGVEPLYFASYLLLPIFLAINRFQRMSSKVSYKAWLELLTLLVCFFLTLSRGAFIGFGLGLIIFLLLGYPRFHIKSLVTAIALSLLISFLAVWAVSGQQGVVNFRNQALIANAPIGASTVDRLAHYRQAVLLFKLHPVVGIGPGLYNSLSKLPRLPEEENNQVIPNTYLELLVETGLFTALSFMALGLAVVGGLFRSYRQRASDALPLLAALIALAIQFNFFAGLYSLFPWALIGLAAGLILSTPSINSNQLSVPTHG